MKFKKLFLFILIAIVQYHWQIYTNPLWNATKFTTAKLWSATKFTTAKLWSATKFTTKITATYATSLVNQIIYKSFKESFMNHAAQNENQLGAQILGAGAGLIGDIGNLLGNQKLEEQAARAQIEILKTDAEERTKKFFDNLDKNFKELTADKQNLLPNIFNLGFSYVILDGTFNKGLSRNILKFVAAFTAFLPILKFIRKKVETKKTSIETLKAIFRNCINIPCTLHQLFIEPIAKIEEKISKILHTILN